MTTPPPPPPPPRPHGATFHALGAQDRAPRPGRALVGPARRLAGWVHRRPWWGRLLLLVLFWWLLLPCWLLVRTDGSRTGLVAAGAVLLVGGAVAFTPIDAPVPTVEDVEVPDGSGSTSSADVVTESDAGGSPPAADGDEEQTGGDTPIDDQVVLTGTVTDVTDGDTLDVDGRTVRLAIADTPERGERCYAEAAEVTEQFRGDDVEVRRPDGAPPLDTFGRLLGEVTRVGDGVSLNETLVARGLASVDERFTDEDPALAARLRRLATAAPAPDCVGIVSAAPSAGGDGAAAVDEPVGIGGVGDAAADETAEATPTVEPTTDPPEPEPAAQVHTGRTDGGWTCHPAYSECLPLGPDLDCAEVGHQVVLFGDADPYRLDGNSTTRSDGLGCESFPPYGANTAYPYG